MEISSTDVSRYTVANQQKLVAMLQTGSISTIITDTRTFEQYAQTELFASLEDSYYDYQGHPSEVVPGIPLTNSQPELVVRFLEYLKFGE